MVKDARRVCYLCKEPSFGLMCKACISGKGGIGSLTRHKSRHRNYLKSIGAVQMPEFKANKLLNDGGSYDVFD